jgi:serine phosphatase RsbU (regulator of sigma subunit)
MDLFSHLVRPFRLIIQMCAGRALFLAPRLRNKTGCLAIGFDMQSNIGPGQPNHRATLIADSELAFAREIHRSLLPRDYVSAQLDIAVRYREADRLGGDYATVQPKANGNIFLAMCDACGHGIASALLAARVNSFVRDHAEQSRDLCDLAESLNSFIFDNFYLSGVFTTFLAAEIRLDQQEILFNNWAQPPGLLYHARNATFEQLGPKRPAMGVMREFRKDCTIASVLYQPGDRLLLYTDGITEARNSAGESFGIKRLQEFLRTAPVSLSSAEAAKTILAQVETFRGQEPCDDRLVMVVSFHDRD